MKYVTLRVRLVQLRGEDRRDFNGGERKGGGGWAIFLLNICLVQKWGGGMREILIKNTFGSKGEGRDFKINLPFYP